MMDYAHTTIYWQLTDNTSSNLTKVYDELQTKHKCRPIKDKGPHKPPYKNLLKKDTELCTLLDPSGSVFGYGHQSTGDRFHCPDAKRPSTLGKLSQQSTAMQ